MTRKQRKYGSGHTGRGVSMSKHRESGIPNPSRRQKEWVARQVNGLSPAYRPPRMFSSLRELFSNRRRLS